jgi:hypothetical protein
MDGDLTAVGKGANARVAHSRGLWIVLGIIALVSVSALRVGWVHDDVMHRAMLAGSLPPVARELDEAYCFVGGPKDYPSPPWRLWWQEHAARICFFRPLASLTLAADHMVLRDSPLAAHLHGFVWFLAACIAVYVLARRLFDARTGAAACLVYGVSSFAGTALSWVAARHALVSAALSAVGLAVYVLGREDLRMRRSVAGLALLTFALTGGEGALGGFGFLVAYEIFRARGSAATRLGFAAAGSAISLAFVIWYVKSGYGTSGVSGYLDPMHGPLDFIIELPGRLVALAGDAIFGVPSEAWLLFNARTVLFVAGAVAILFVLGTVTLVPMQLEQGTKRSLRFLLVGAVLAALPAAAAILGGRVLLLPGVGLSIVLVASLLPRWRLASALPRNRRYAARALCGAVLAGIFVFNPALRIARDLHLHKVELAEQRLAMSTLEGCEAADRFLVLGNNEFAVSLYAPYLLAKQIGARRWTYVTNADDALLLERTDEHTLRVSTDKGNAIAGLSFELARPDRSPFSSDVGISLDGPSIHVEESSDLGVKAFRIDNPHSFDDPSLCWLRFDGERLVRTLIPEVGKRMTLEYHAGVMPL